MRPTLANKQPSRARQTKMVIGSGYDEQQTTEALTGCFSYMLHHIATADLVLDGDLYAWFLVNQSAVTETFTSIFSMAFPLKIPRVGGTSA
jgi:hypothetical protein